MNRGRGLTTLLRVRELLERRAEAELGQQQIATTRAGVERDEAAAAYTARPRPAGQLTPIMLRALQLSGVRSHELADAATAAYDEASRAREAARSSWAEASTRRRVAERLHERRQAEAELLAQAAAQRTLDELVALRWEVQR